VTHSSFIEGSHRTENTASGINYIQLGCKGLPGTNTLAYYVQKKFYNIRPQVKMTERLPLYHDDDLISNHSATSPPLHGKDTTMDTMVGGLHDAEVVVHPDISSFLDFDRISLALAVAETLGGINLIFV